MKNNKVNQYYSLKRLLNTNALYMIGFGERSNGKTYSVLEYGISDFWKNGNEMAIIRRFAEDIKGERAERIFQGINENGVVEKVTNGEWNFIDYYWGKWWLARYDMNSDGENKEKIIRHENPLAYRFALTSSEHDKMLQYPKIRNILFDEFISRTGYLKDEFIVFCNTLSTIIRDRENIKIFMMGNTVNKYCPYFAEMGLINVKKMNIGDLDIYQYGDSDLTVAVEYTGTPEEMRIKKKSDKYFAFDNPKLKMITSGAWEIAIYPHCPCQYERKDIIFKFFIQFDGECLQCEIVMADKSYFIYIHHKTTPLKNDKKDLIFTPEHSHLPNWRRKITKPTNKIEKKIAELFIKEKVFYQNNEVGEIVRNYLMWCKGE